MKKMPPKVQKVLELILDEMDKNLLNDGLYFKSKAYGLRRAAKILLEDYGSGSIESSNLRDRIDRLIT